MKNLIKSQLFELKRNRVVYIIFAAILFMQIVEIISEGYDKNMSNYMAYNSMIFYSFAAIGGTLIALVGVGGDFIDKTSNYEILNGHTRLEIFSGRVITSTIVGTLAYLLLMLVPFFMGVILFGFGTDISARELAIRMFLSIFVEIRLICIFTTFTFICNPYYYISMVVSGVYLMLAASLLTQESKFKSLLLGSTTFNRLGEFISWKTYSIGNGIEEIDVLGRVIGFGEGASISGISIAISIVALVFGYYFFKKDDLH